jgi:hypothetical protein
LDDLNNVFPENNQHTHEGTEMNEHFKREVARRLEVQQMFRQDEMPRAADGKKFR